MIEVKYLQSKTVYAAIAVIFVTTALVTLPYQNQVANAAPTKRIQAVVTLTDVPANAEDLEMNATINRSGALTQFETVTSPTDGDSVKFVWRVPSETNLIDLIVCAHTRDFRLSDCDQHSLPSKVSGPIRVDFAYPS